MFHSLQEFCRRHLADDAPVEMDLCLDCGVLECFGDQFEACVRRKARAADLRGERVAIPAKKQAAETFDLDVFVHLKRTGRAI